MTEEAEDPWHAAALVMLEAAAGAPRREVVALGDFAAESDVDLAVSEGEKLWLCDCQAPEAWIIVQRMTGDENERHHGTAGAGAGGQLSATSVNLFRQKDAEVRHEVCELPKELRSFASLSAPALRSSSALALISPSPHPHLYP